MTYPAEWITVRLDPSAIDSPDEWWHATSENAYVPVFVESFALVVLAPAALVRRDAATLPAEFVSADAKGGRVKLTHSVLIPAPERLFAGVPDFTAYVRSYIRRVLTPPPSAAAIAAATPIASAAASKPLPPLPSFVDQLCSAPLSVNLRPVTGTAMIAVPDPTGQSDPTFVPAVSLPNAAEFTIGTDPQRTRERKAAFDARPVRTRCPLLNFFQLWDGMSIAIELFDKSNPAPAARAAQTDSRAHYWRDTVAQTHAHIKHSNEVASVSTVVGAGLVVASGAADSTVVGKLSRKLEQPNPRAKMKLRDPRGASTDGMSELTPEWMEANADTPVLDLCGSAVRVLPKEIANWSKLTEIMAYSSLLDTVPREIGACRNFRKFTPYTGYNFHYLPFEILQCGLTNSTISTRALYMNRNNDWPLPALDPWPIDHVVMAVYHGKLRALKQAKSAVPAPAFGGAATTEPELARTTISDVYSLVCVPDLKHRAIELATRSVVTEDDLLAAPKRMHSAAWARPTNHSRADIRYAYGALDQKYGGRTDRVELMVQLIDEAMAGNSSGWVRELGTIIASYTCTDALGCSLCMHPYVGRPYMLWTHMRVCSHDDVALLVHACSLRCALSVERYHYDPILHRHVRTNAELPREPVKEPPPLSELPTISATAAAPTDSKLE